MIKIQWKKEARMEILLRISVCALFFVLLGVSRVEGDSVLCPDTIDPENPAWVLYRIHSEDKKDSRGRANAWKRTFLYQPDLGKRIRGEYELECVGRCTRLLSRGKKQLL